VIDLRVHRDRWSRISHQVAQILHEDWDPIGINDVPNAFDEYHDYVLGAVALRARNATAAEIEAYLLDIERNTMGLSGRSNERRANTALKISNLPYNVASMPDLVKLLEDSGAILKGHFLLTSGRHSDTYFEKFRILEKPDVLSEVCGEIASHFHSAGIELVTGPTTGGIIIAFEVARRLGVPALYVEREDGKRVLRRGASVAQGAKVLVVDDVFTTGTSVAEVVTLLREMKAEVAAIAVLVDRSEKPVDFGAPFFAAVKVEAQSYADDEVPDWLAEIPITKPGTR
jgi:orotate phosphoribosyltransferase